MLALLPGACARAQASPAPDAVVPSVEVGTTVVVEREVPKFLAVSGTLVGNRQSDVAADVTGRVVETHVERGTFVAKGAVLARVDARGAALSRREAAALVASARVEQDTARLECERAERLYAAAAISQAELDRTRARCVSSGHSEQVALARQQMAEKDIGDRGVRSPFAGMVVEREISVGEYVTPGRRVATVVELDPLRLELTVPELASTAVRVGSPVEFQLKAFPKERFSGEVRYVGPVLRRATRDLIVEAIVKNPEHRLRPGMFAQAELVLGRQTLPVVPRTALTGSEGSRRAFVVQENVIEERVVLAGSADGESIAIIKGLKAGDRVVTRPTAQVKDGVRVR